VVRITTSPVLEIKDNKKVPLTVEEGIQLWSDLAKEFERTHEGFRANFILCAVKRLGRAKI